MSEAYIQLRDLMCSTASINPKDLSKSQQTVIFIHFCNLQFGLICVNSQQQKIEFPANWNQPFQNVYKFNYKLESQVIQFRFIDNAESNGSVLVNYVEENGDDLHQIQVLYEKERFEECMKKYQANLKENLKKQKKTEVQEVERERPVRRLSPVYRAPYYPPLGGFGQNPGNNVFINPYNSGEYVGPDHQIFRGPNRGNHPQQPGQMRPPGARYDPVDPFNSRGLDQPDAPDFYGFNSQGQPFGGNPKNGGNFF